SGTAAAGGALPCGAGDDIRRLFSTGDGDPHRRASRGGYASTPRICRGAHRASRLQPISGAARQNRIPATGPVGGAGSKSRVALERARAVRGESTIRNLGSGEDCGNSEKGGRQRNSQAGPADRSGTAQDRRV